MSALLPPTNGPSHNLKTLQLTGITSMLSLENPSSPSSSPSASPSASLKWKVLIYDIAGRSIISPLLSVSALRSLGVTLHLLISTTRTAIPAVPAVYFLEPTESNIRQIALDAKNNLYSAGLHINFTRKLPRPLLELLGQLLVQYNAVAAVLSVVDRYLDFVSLEPTLFTLNHKTSYKLVHGNTATEDSVNQYMETCVSSLTSLLSLYPGMPIIKTPTAGPGNYLGSMLCKSLKDTPSPASRAAGPRPTLLILDRSDDVATSIMHSSTYQSLLADTLQYESNRVKVPNDVAEGAPKTVASYDLDEEKDEFWRKAKFMTFPEAIEFHQEELKRITTAEEAVRSKTNVVADDTKNLSDAVSSLPELLEQKKMLETHTHILQQIMGCVGRRGIPDYLDLELKVMEGLKINADNVKKDVAELLAGAGEVRDKLRLVLICCLYLRLDKSEVEIYKSTLVTQCGGDPGLIALVTKSVDACRGLASTKEGFVESLSSAPTSGGGGGGSRQSELLNKFTAGAISGAAGLLAGAAATVAGMAGRERTCRAAKYVENVVCNREGLDLATFDPASNAANPETPATNVVVVFMLGGGGFEERRTLAKLRCVQSLVYGCTQLGGGDLVDQLAGLN